MIGVRIGRRLDVLSLDVGESFHSRLRDECLDREWFHSLAEARVILEQYRRHYNEARPPLSLGYRTPAEVGQHRAPIR